ncbi:hypothetical protein ACSMX9_08465 [Streptomyces sp. LE64]|uniref:hypothetical protein n=1 Tax=Streptomyces sp. LE64 TaxID=3448653 RepID=UPI0040424958
MASSPEHPDTAPARSTRTPALPPPTPAATAPRTNTAFRALRGARSPGEFAAAVRRAAREIGERVSCDARYIGRVEAGEIRCPNYAYERVFLHMFPGRSLSDLGFAPRSAVRGRAARPTGPERPRVPGPSPSPAPDARAPGPRPEAHRARRHVCTAAASAGGPPPVGLGPLDAPDGPKPGGRAGAAEAAAVEEAVRRIRVLDDRHGADGLYRRAAAPLRTAFELLDAATARQSTADRLHAGAGELAISVGWLAHDSGRFADARSHYAEALATARMCGDAGVEAHAFCNTSFLARDTGHPREAVRTAQAGQRAARGLGSALLLSLLALREAGGWAGLGDRARCSRALARARVLFERGRTHGDAERGAAPEWMSFYGAAEFAGLEAQCWSALGEWSRAADHAERAVRLQEPHFVRNTALYTAELADDLARAGRPDEAAAAGERVLGLLDEVQSSRVQSMVAATARVLLPHRRSAGVGAFLDRYAALPRPA